MDQITTINGEPLVILLVEDNLSHTELIRRSLQDHHITNRIYHVSDGEAALSYLFHRAPYLDPVCSPQPHLIILDLRLPKVDGLEVLKEIKSHKELRRIPVVIVTTSEAERDMVQAYDNYANSYLVKPVDFNQFTQLMHDLGFYWLGWNRHPWLPKGT